jgi:hypothetical protein
MTLRDVGVGQEVGQPGANLCQAAPLSDPQSVGAHCGAAQVLEDINPAVGLLAALEAAKKGKFIYDRAQPNQVSKATFVRSQEPRLCEDVLDVITLSQSLCVLTTPCEW